MLSKKRRISKKHFPYILTKGKRYNTPHLLMYINRVDSGNQNQASQFSFSISKKVAPKAVDRNKYRRRGYSVIRRHINRIKSGYLLLFSFKKGRANLKFSELEKEILELLSNYNMLE